eukprot:1478121-Rhodomonas_salina.2
MSDPPTTISSWYKVDYVGKCTSLQFCLSAALKAAVQSRILVGESNISNSMTSTYTLPTQHQTALSRSFILPESV